MPNMLTAFIPLAHVQNILESQAFYERFGMILQARFGPEGDPYWAHLVGIRSNLMLSKASGPIDPGQQAVLFYLHTTDLVELRETLMASGVADGGSYRGAGEDDFPRSGKLFDITYPDYMPLGEMRVHDPDGYVLLVGQARPTT